jgi:tRNA A37 threonylcarbamoyladenosine synthetase subunit TsaC/SUA5/YrdC
VNATFYLSLTLICPAYPTLDWALGGVGGGAVALRVPLHPVLLELLAETGPLAVTGANTPGHPMPTTYAEAYGQQGEFPAVYLDAGPTCYGGPSTIVDVRGARPRVVRSGALDTAVLREVASDLLDLEEAGA